MCAWHYLTGPLRTTRDAPVDFVKPDAPPLDGEDHTEDIDFSSAGIRCRRDAGYEQTRPMIDCHSWTEPVDRPRTC